MTETTLQGLAEEARAFFVRDTRDDGSHYWHAKNDRPAWVQELCYAAHGHGDMLPDDWRYQFIVDALDALSENEDADDARDSLEASIYTHELTEWLGSHGYRPGYCDEALKEYGMDFKDTFSLMQLGQLTEMWEVFDQVRGFLETRLEEDEEEGEG